jgi:hypothetical protein
MSRAVEIPFEPLTALAGGILGGVLVGALVWRALWKGLRSTEHISQALNPRGVPA